MLNNLWNDELGAVISAELVLVLTIAVLAMIVGLSEVAVAVNTELNDASNAIGALNQSYGVTGFRSEGPGLVISFVRGSRFQDVSADCDTNRNCDLVGGRGSMTPEAGN